VTKPDVVDIVPRVSIGEIRLGAKVSELPGRASLNPPAGEFDGIRFVLDENQLVSDIWIEDLRTFKKVVRVQGKSVPSNASIAELEAVLGACTQVSGVKGGFFYNCASGLALGTDLAKTTLQVRVKHR
jgi:hypothetical protein